MNLFSRSRFGPIGVDLGSKSIKLLQLDADRNHLIDSACTDYPLGDASAEELPLALKISRTMEGHRFRGREAVLSVGGDQLFIQNMRIPKVSPEATERAVHQEAAGKLPYPIADAEIRYLEIDDVRQGDQIMREVIVLATPRDQLHEMIHQVEVAGLRPIAVEIEPLAMLRSLVRRYRREEDQHLRQVLFHIGYQWSLVVITQGDNALFIKYFSKGGRQFDEAVGNSFEMTPEKGGDLRRKIGRRCTDTRDHEIASGVMRAMRPVIDGLLDDVDRCIRYHNVTFRGKSIDRVILSGGEASTTLQEIAANRLGFECELGNPLPVHATNAPLSCPGKWDVAAGLAFHEGGASQCNR